MVASVSESLLEEDIVWWPNFWNISSSNVTRDGMNVTREAASAFVSITPSDYTKKKMQDIVSLDTEMEVDNEMGIGLQSMGIGLQSMGIIVSRRGSRPSF